MRALLPVSFLSLLSFTAVLVAAGCSSEDASPGSTPTDGGASGAEGGPDGAEADAATDAGASADGSDAAISDAGAEGGADAGTMTLTSTAFTAGGTIPVVHTCDGAGASIPLSWSGAPVGTQSYAVVMRDLTLAGQANYHWVLWDVPAAVTSLAQGIANTASPDPPGGGAKQTYWSFGAQYGYGNPCPIAGPSTHDYQIVVYALPVATLPPPADPTSAPEVAGAVAAAAIATGSLTGKYTKQ